MKIIFFLGILGVFLACNPKIDRTSSIKMGQTDNMRITDHNKTFKGVWVGKNEVNEREVTFDIDSDGDVDFKLVSFTDSIANSSPSMGEMTYGVYINFPSDNGHYSKKHSENLSIISSQRDTILPSQSNLTNYELQKISCIGDFYNPGQINVDKFIKRLEGSEVVSDYLGDWDLKDQKRNLIYHSNYSTYSNNVLVEYNFDCFNVEKNKVFFIPIEIKGPNTSIYALGWIELEILENNTVHIIRTAIQE